MLPHEIQPLEYVIGKGMSGSCGMPRGYWNGAASLIRKNAHENLERAEKAEAFAAAMHLNVPYILKSVFGKTGN